jgi:hypothetical protein
MSRSANDGTDLSWLAFMFEFIADRACEKQGDLRLYVATGAEHKRAIAALSRFSVHAYDEGASVLSSLLRRT